MTTHSHTSFVANYDGSILSQYNTYMHSHPKEGEQGYSEADWNAWRQMHSEGDGIICDFGVYTVSDGKAKSYSYDVRYNHPDKSHWGNNCMTEVSVVAPKESQASFSARWKARWYMLRRQEERAPSRGRACSVEGWGWRLWESGILSACRYRPKRGRKNHPARIKYSHGIRTPETSICELYQCKMAS